MSQNNKIWLPVLGVMLALLLILVAREGWTKQQGRAHLGVRARVRAFVLPQMSLSFDSGLVFSDASPGAPPQRVSPDDSRALRCTLGGAPNSVIQLRYPDSVVLQLPGSRPTPDAQVRINDIQASSANGSVVLRPESQVRWGGTRDRLRFTQWEGKYVGTLNVTVVHP